MLRYLLAVVCLAACGAPTEPDCTAGSCTGGKVCNVNTGMCLANPDAGSGGGAGGGTGGGSAGGSGGGGGGGSAPLTALVTVRYFIDACPGTCPETCVVTDCAASQVQMAAATWNSIRASQTGCTAVSKGSITWDLDCRDAGQPGTYTCLDGGSTFIRDVHTVYTPPGADSTVCAYSTP